MTATVQTTVQSLNGYMYRATQGFQNGKRVLIEDVRTGERPDMVYVLDRKTTYRDTRKIIIRGRTTGNDSVRIILNLESQGRDVTIKIGER